MDGSGAEKRLLCRAVQLVASRCTSYAIQAPKLTASSLENEEKKYSSRNAPYCSEFALSSSPQYQLRKSSPHTPLCWMEYLVGVFPYLTFNTRVCQLSPWNKYGPNLHTTCCYEYRDLVPRNKQIDYKSYESVFATIMSCLNNLYFVRNHLYKSRLRIFCTSFQNWLQVA